MYCQTDQRITPLPEKKIREAVDNFMQRSVKRMLRGKKGEGNSKATNLLLKVHAIARNYKRI